MKTKSKIATIQVLPPELNNRLIDMELVLEKIRSGVAYIKMIIRDHEVEDGCLHHEDLYLEPNAPGKKKA